MNDLLPYLPTILLGVGALILVLIVLRGFWNARRNQRLRDNPPSEPTGSLFLPEEREPTGPTGRFDRRFEQMVADTGTGLDSAQAVGILALGAVIGAGIPLLFRDDLVLIFLGVAAGVFLPLLYLLWRRSRYRQAVQDQLPDSLFLLSRSLRAGQNLEQSLGTAARYGTQPLAGEFRRAVDQINLGMTVPTALQSMARRVRLNDFNILVTAVTLHRNVGGNLATLLDRVATAVRDRNLFRGYFLAATALGRITAFVIAAAPIAILVGYAVWQPEFIERFTSSAAGLAALGTAAVLWIIGVIWMFALLRIDY